MTANCTFPKAVRLLTASEYRQVFQDVQVRVSSQNFLILAKDQKKDYPRIGIIVAKKNVKLAVQRNRIKRLLRETFRNERALLPKIDIIVLTKKGVHEVENSVMLTELDYLWRKLKRKAQV